MIKPMNVVSVNRRKVKKIAKELMPSDWEGLVESYQGLFVVMHRTNSSYVCLQHAPGTKWHHQTRNVPFSLAKLVGLNKTPKLREVENA